ncbi:hypothetical protein ABE29_23030 [Cytobacillus firmus]|nr:hypothetical protein [Cytobacillus firmus]MBG9557950.1 hypothetical protein [Cytobacillus firmus]
MDNTLTFYGEGLFFLSLCFYARGTREFWGLLGSHRMREVLVVGGEWELGERTSLSNTDFY